MHKHGFRIAEHNMHLRTLGRHAHLFVAGRVLSTEEDLIVLGRSVVKEVLPVYKRRVSKAWVSFRARPGTRVLGAIGGPRYPA